MSDTVIRVENLSKRYVLGQSQESYSTLRDRLAHKAKNVFQSRSDRKSQVDEFWALQDVSFEIKQGDRVGIIGRNGAGKSTLLKILSRITEPTAGRIGIQGRVASLLEVGTGFHPELTGRENIYLNGAILGMSKAEIQRKFDEIVAFAEVEKFLDTPVKRYSSGMYVRLAFAVAAHLEPEILVVDEVLAVGDALFQKKCLGKMHEIGKEGRTVIFVSHNMAAINALCGRGILLHQGSLVHDGTTEDCVAAYEASNGNSQGSMWMPSQDDKTVQLAITKIESSLVGVQPNLALQLEISLESRTNHKAAFLAVDILDTAGVSIMQALPQLEGFIKYQQLSHSVCLNIDLPPLIPGIYLVSVWVGSHNTETLDCASEAISFEVVESPTYGRSFPHTKSHGYIVPKCSYSYTTQRDFSYL
jgi:lipopolysaccharide transport system ATP-binding protein